MAGCNAPNGTPPSTPFISPGRVRSPRRPTRDILRDTGGLVEEAFEIYKTARTDGRTPKKAVTAVVNEMELNRRRINTWAQRYEWEATLTKDS